MEEAGGTNANVQLLRKAARTEKEPRLETEGLGGLKAEIGTGQRAPGCLGREGSLHTWALLFSQAQGRRVAMG